ncbi:alpha/beta hydrolase [Halomicrobium salinisoli]|uniref:alpha/beta hydrolase n=1 Tax=Halomicrobium salinisoli TaxID=2878391 RepID=UPI001CF0891E|nr:dienelactone hydrolase family protein [Halomicrobium salinisoli]
MADLPLTYQHRPPETESGSAPVVILLHGLGADEGDLFSYADVLPEEYHVLSVRGPHSSTGGGYAWMGSGQDRFAESISALTAFAERLPDACDVDGDRIGLLGFSQGAKAALVALLEEPALFAWVVSLNGFLPRSHSDESVVERARGKSVFVGVGEHDSVISPELGAETAETLSAAGLDVTVRSYPVGHAIADQEVEDVAEWLRTSV